jgi:transglutaminase-like putative cysteine protease
VPPQISRKGSFVDYRWSFDNVEKGTVDEDRPNWHFGFPVFELSSFETWQEVSRFFAHYYEVTDQMPANVTREIDTIRSKNLDEAARTRAALDFVQREIRYLGIEIGQGGYIPRKTELTLDRRFGDCKDMTYLLLTMLDGLGINADAVLVNSSERAGVEVNAPSSVIFDHVIVRTKFNDKVYFWIRREASN